MPHDDVLRGLRIDLATALRERDEAKARERGQMTAVLHTIGGEVEGHPTSAIDYLQRLRALVATEKAFADARPQIESAKYMVEKARDCERAESALAAARRECTAARGWARIWKASAAAYRAQARDMGFLIEAGTWPDRKEITP